MYKNICSAFYFLKQTKNRDSALTSANTEQWVFCFPGILSEMELKATGAHTHARVYVWNIHMYWNRKRKKKYVKEKFGATTIYFLEKQASSTPTSTSAFSSLIPISGAGRAVVQVSKVDCRNRAFSRVVETSFYRWAKVLRDGCWLLTSKFN